MSPEERAQLTDRDLLVRIDTRQEEQIKTIQDHETRIRKNETEIQDLKTRPVVTPRHLWVGLTGAVAAISGAIPVINWVVHK